MTGTTVNAIETRRPPITPESQEPEKAQRFGGNGWCDETFDWRSDDTVILGHQPATAVYMSAQKQVIIRQERPWDETDDPFIYLNPESAGAVIFQMALLLIDASETDGMTAQQLRRVAQSLLTAADKLAEPPSSSAKDVTGAERQRRYRDRHRNVTPADTHNGSDRDAPLLKQEG